LHSLATPLAKCDWPDCCGGVGDACGALLCSARWLQCLLWWVSSSMVAAGVARRCALARAVVVNNGSRWLREQATDGRGVLSIGAV
jgi:hypothetical protein